MRLNMPSTILEETSQFDESQQYFLSPSPEIKRTVEAKLTSTILDTTFIRLIEQDDDIESVSISQITIDSPPRRLIKCESFVDRDCSLICFDNPLCDSIIEEETIDEKSFERVNCG